MITPPFVIGLALIMLFGRPGGQRGPRMGVRRQPTRWIYGLPGVWLAQTLALTPVAYLVLVGVVEGISPSLEEPRRRLRASPRGSSRRSRCRCSRRDSLNAFLIVFIESLADFGNPLLLGGNLEVLSVAIYFAIVGVQQDPGTSGDPCDRLLALLARAFPAADALWRAGSFVTDLGQGRGRAAPAAARARRPHGAAWRCRGLALALVVYAMIFCGGFFEKWGLNHALTLRHYVTAFGVDVARAAHLDGRRMELVSDHADDRRGVGAADRGFGLLVAVLCSPARFAGKGAFEFITMLSFAMPGPSSASATSSRSTRRRSSSPTPGSSSSPASSFAT
jgi:iron(III) transport system permease protein